MFLAIKVFKTNEMLIVVFQL